MFFDFSLAGVVSSLHIHNTRCPPRGQVIFWTLGRRWPAVGLRVFVPSRVATFAQCHYVRQFVLQCRIDTYWHDMVNLNRGLYPAILITVFAEWVVYPVSPRQTVPPPPVGHFMLSLWLHTLTAFATFVGMSLRTEFHHGCCVSCDLKTSAYPFLTPSL